MIVSMYKPNLYIIIQYYIHMRICNIKYTYTILICVESFLYKKLNEYLFDKQGLIRNIFIERRRYL